MLTVLVHIHVKPECVDAFLEATLENARNSRLEPAIAQFDLLRQTDDPARFVLIEVYRNSDGQARHRETAHYSRWRKLAEPMMAEPRAGVRYESVA